MVAGDYFNFRRIPTHAMTETPAPGNHPGECALGGLSGGLSTYIIYHGGKYGDCWRISAHAMAETLLPGDMLGNGPQYE